MRIRSAVLVVVALAMILLGACGGSSKAPRPSAAASSALTIENFKFSPSPLAAKVGDTITITNKDSTNHTVTADDSSFDTGPFQGQRTITVSMAGTIAFHCAIHDYMKGVIQVSA